MNRASGITAVAVVAIIEGIFSCLFGLLALLGLAMMRLVPQTVQSSRQTAAAGIIVGIEVLIFLGIGGWTIASAIGLLRLKNWGRISLAVVGGVFAALNLFGVVGAAMMTRIQLPPETPNVPPNFMAIMGGIFAAICLIQAAIGIWWLVYLNLGRVRAQFSARATASTDTGVQPPAVVTPSSIDRPLSILIIGWLMAVSGLLCLPIYLTSSYPALILGVLVDGWPGRAFYLAFSLAYVGIGIGLIRVHPLSRQLAIALCVFGSVNALLMAFVPGAVRKFMEITMQRLPSEQAWMSGMVSKFMWLGVLFGLTLNGVQLWFLITRKEAYLAAARQREVAAPAA
jgi:hypothetical protein